GRREMDTGAWVRASKDASTQSLTLANAAGWATPTASSLTRARLGASSAATMPKTVSPAATQSAWVKPSTNAWGEPEAPRCGNTAASTATPKTPPSSRIALFAPDATPTSAGGTDATTAFATVGKQSEVPTPATVSATPSSAYPIPGFAIHATHPSPIACSAR